MLEEGSPAVEVDGAYLRNSWGPLVVKLPVPWSCEHVKNEQPRSAHSFPFSVEANYVPSLFFFLSLTLSLLLSYSGTLSILGFRVGY